MKKALVLCVITFLVLMGILVYVEYGLSRTSASASWDQPMMLPPVTAAGAATERTIENARVETEIQTILDEYYRIARTNNRQALENFTRKISAPEYRYSSELGVMDKRETLRYMDSLDRQILSSGYEDLQVRPHGNAAVVKYLDVSLVRSAWGMERLKQTRFTSFWVKRDGKWQIVAEHSSMLAPAKLAPRYPFGGKVARNVK